MPNTTRLLMWLTFAVCVSAAQMLPGYAQATPGATCADAQTTLVAPMGLAATPHGLNLIVDRGLQAVFSIDAAMGDCKLVSSVRRGTGPAFNAPVGVVADGRAYYVIDPGAGAVFAIDP